MAAITVRTRRPLDIPIALIGTSALVAAAMLLPIAYLVVRVWNAGVFWDEVTAPATRDAIVRTALLAAATTAGAIAISLPLAWLTTRTDLPFRRAWSVLLVLPLAIPSYVGAFTFIAALGPRGMLQDALEPLGVDRLPEIYGFWGAWAALTLFTFPYVMMPVRASLRGIDRSIEEAARGLGAGSLRAFARVTLPQLRPAIAAGGLLVALYTLSDFGAVSLLRFDSLTRIIYVRYTSSFDRSSAAALALLLVALTLVVVTLESATRGRARYHATSRHQPPSVVRLGHWRWPALAFCSFILTVSLLLPVSVIAYWLFRGIDAGEPVGFVREAAYNSVYASGFAAVAAAIACMPVAILAVRYPSMLSSAIEKIT
ncbi:MAG: iron ABC transporter permease, partial [Dehalococcoidia bacterium]